MTQTTKADYYVCPGCKAAGLTIFHEVPCIPVHSMLTMKTREMALNYPKGDVVLGFCATCGFISNVAFQPELLEYSTDCEESQGFSPTFRTFARRIATELIEKYHIRQKTILEIGCGQAEFLTLLCDIGDNTGIGFDPVYSPGRDPSQAAQRVRVIQDFYSERYADYAGDLLCCQMTLEHIPDTARFLRMIRTAIGERLETIVFFQVPNVARILRECAFEDIYYEHCSYFSPDSLTWVFQNNGFAILDIRTEYNDQYLLLEARPIAKEVLRVQPLSADSVEMLVQQIAGFQHAYSAMLDYWHGQLRWPREQRQKVVIWGSGSKGVAFLNVLGVSEQIEYVVDINPYRQGAYMPGTGQRIVSPDFLQEYRPQMVLVMNAIYQEEIRQMLANMGMFPELQSLGDMNRTA